jgi:hypothetical protein
MPAKKKKDDNYFENLGKEFAQFMRARANANDKEMDYRVGKYGTPQMNPNPKYDISRGQREKAKAIKKEKSALGQLAGAALQGRRYKGNKQVTKKKK